MRTAAKSSFLNALTSVVIAGCAWPSFVLPAQQVPTSADVLRDAAKLHSEHRDQAAADLLQGYLGRHADDLDVLLSLAQLRLDQGDVDAASDLSASTSP